MPISLEEFARLNQLPLRWILLRRECNVLTGNPQFWYRRDLQDHARKLATEASEILRARSIDQNENLNLWGPDRNKTIA
jgi:hypothetical protein